LHLSRDSATLQIMTKTKKRTLRPSVFTKAAQLIEEECEDFACLAIEEIAGTSAPERQFFITTLKPRTDSNGLSLSRSDPWYSSCFNMQYYYDERTARILGLLLCAQLVKEGWK
jgi:hypothetical protein